MKSSVYALLLLGVFACNKSDNPKPIVTTHPTPGVVEGFLKGNPKISVIRTIDSKITYDSTAATHRGYMFVPQRNILLTAIGGRIAANGTYGIELYHCTSGNCFVSTLSPTTPILLDSITIDDPSKFKYLKVDSILLQAGEWYLIRYFNKDHTSVFDAGTASGEDAVHIPQMIRDISIEAVYYTYARFLFGHWIVVTEGGWDPGILRGLPDFEYVLP